MYVCMYGWYGMVWYGMVWNGMEWNGMECNVMYVCVYVCIHECVYMYMYMCACIVAMYAIYLKGIVRQFYAGYTPGNDPSFHCRSRHLQLSAT